MNVPEASPIPFAVVQSDTTIFDPPLYGIDVFAPGVVAIHSPIGTVITKTFPAAADGGWYPCRWVVQIRRILDTGTTVADANLVALK
jgi:hypothetical protein